ncbi:FMN-binding glutamate synthase family protein [Verrucomicrobiaceae bacterium N1E253]|uniref:FMN-binding glutamate synthase family protein n=1 Tax=Oceaniferula marina TaxID=2748318 RepID=A0A851G8V6_9BACT|nr:FMN-binding glutamate synthase family protein [Oceaniferula marina]NWK54043.1 FMN-binding glutamate synthase family protein [Oceaniferula marina]
MSVIQILSLVFIVILIIVVVYDLIQKRHAILRNFPIIGHFRYFLEAIGPELRQYIVTDNDEERPFNRDQRRWIYASSKNENNYFGFGSDNDMELTPNYLILKQSTFPHPPPQPPDPLHPAPCAKVLGAARKRAKAFRPSSIVNISGMSFGALGSAATRAINEGCGIAGCLQNTGEGGVSEHHCHGGELMLQIGTGYFGCRDANGHFSMAQLLNTIEKHPHVKAIEIKLSQGAKAGLGGLLPKQKITQEIASARGIPTDRDCNSPAHHSAFHDPDSLLDLVEAIAKHTGLPVGIKSAVGQLGFWDELAELMADGSRGVDFITIDGGEGGTGASPLAFSDHVSLPFKYAFPQVFSIFARAGLSQNIVFIGSAKLGFPMDALFAFGLGCDMISVAREAMISIGCIQAQRCHTGHCPAGVATHNRWLMRGLDPQLKAARLANYVVTLRYEIIKLCHAAGFCHPAFLTTNHFEILDGQLGTTSFKDLFGYDRSSPCPCDEDCKIIRRMMECHRPKEAAPAPA